MVQNQLHQVRLGGFQVQVVGKQLQGHKMQVDTTHKASTDSVVSNHP